MILKAINTGGSSIAHNQPTWASPATNASDGTSAIAAIARNQPTQAMATIAREQHE